MKNIQSLTKKNSNRNRGQRMSQKGLRIRKKGNSEKIIKKPLSSDFFSIRNKDGNLRSSNGLKKSKSIKIFKRKYNFCVRTKKGYNPSVPEKQNQDAFLIKKNFMGQSHFHIFAVFDGHGKIPTFLRILNYFF